ncbi:MAG: carboxypeptidase regulatory-like domain-containing protein [Wenzhouxiangellaceae bacterium]|nr:carboxypeptidase regulatory-like domain-containing protein [Wenzhouxiangellaceae bacterium]
MRPGHFSGQAGSLIRGHGRLAILAFILCLVLAFVFLEVWWAPNPPVVTESGLPTTASSAEAVNIADPDAPREPGESSNPARLQPASSTTSPGSSANNADSPTATGPLPHSPDRQTPAASAQDEEAPDLAIRGAVLDDTGAPLASLVVKLEALQALASPGLTQAPLARATTNHLGMFDFEALRAGEYQLRIDDTDHLFGTTRAVRAGTDHLTLHLQRKGALQVFGQVTDPDGAPLENAWVRAFGLQQRTATNASGEYALEFQLRRVGEVPVLEFEHHLFRSTTRRVPLAQGHGFEPVRLDVQLLDEYEHVAVYGTVFGPQLEPVAGARVVLMSPSLQTRQSTVSGDQGDYLLEQVAVGPGYRLRVTPNGERYRQYLSESFPIGPHAMQRDIALEAGERATVSGLLFDPEGTPLSDFTLWLRSDNGAYPLPIHTDHQGRFGTIDVAAGNLTLETHSAPWLRVTGITVAAGEYRAIRAPLDWGQNWLLGQVVDAQGQALSQVRITLQWATDFGEIRSTSQRAHLSDMLGRFEFANLGARVYQLTAQSPGYAIERTTISTTDGAEIRIQLRRTASATDAGAGP